MHCPNCGQKQVSNEIKFCSRCGFPMGLVAEILGHGGFLPQLAELNKKKSLFTKKNGVIFGVMWFIAFTMLFTSIMAITNAPEEMVAVTAVIGVFGSLMLIIGSLSLLPSSKTFSQFSPTMQPPMPNAHGLPGVGPQQALPAQQSIPVNVYAPPKAGSWRNTNDLEPTSVTESTTKLLDQEDNIQ